MYDAPYLLYDIAIKIEKAKESHALNVDDWRHVVKTLRSWADMLVEEHLPSGDPLDLYFSER